MKPQYYFYCTYEYNHHSGWAKSYYCISTFSPIFPFTKMLNILMTSYGMQVMILDWKELTKEEFEEVEKASPYLTPDTVVAFPQG